MSINDSYDCVSLLGNSPNAKKHQLAMEVKLLRCFVTKMLYAQQKSFGYSSPFKPLCQQLNVTEPLMSLKPYSSVSYRLRC